MASSEEIPSTENVQAAASTQSAVVLVIEDEEPLRKLVSRALSAAGYRVVTARDGIEGLRVFEKEPNGFDLVLLDLTMPQMDGRDVFVRLKSMASSQKIVLMSGFGNSDRGVRSPDQQADDFLQKPFGMRDLIAVVNAQVAGS